ncbi:MAG: hypothetical protein U5M50_15935 [Sphingobium sp.]|nr:hypothetical protein [Sphingobium sp.]
MARSGVCSPDDDDVFTAGIAAGSRNLDLLLRLRGLCRRVDAVFDRRARLGRDDAAGWSALRERLRRDERRRREQRRQSANG